MPDDQEPTDALARRGPEDPEPDSERSSLDRALAFPVKVAGDLGRMAVPAWRAQTEGEHRWMVTTAVGVAIGLQLTLPPHLALPPWWLLPGLGAALLAGLMIANPVHIDRRSSPVRAASIGLTIVLSLANAVSAARLIARVLEGTFGSTAGPLLLSGGAIWATNVIVFGLWYWELDRGGPAARAHGVKTHPDLLFPQQTGIPGWDADRWRPGFGDYLFVAFTGATAFSPTDTLPLSFPAKLIMTLVSSVSLITIGILVARAVNAI